MRIARPFLFFVLALFVLFAFQATPTIWAQSSAAEPVIIYFFWGNGCPHCADAEPFLESLANRYPGVQVRSFEVWASPENLDLLKKMGTAYGFEPSGVPTIFIGSQHWQGYNDTISQEIENAVQSCLAGGCQDAGIGIAPSNNNSPLPAQPVDVPPDDQTSSNINLPLIGEVNLESQSLLVSTLLISFVDGFNPCSLWVLSMLLALTLHTGSRKKILVIGLIFLTVTALVYALFIAGLFTMFTVISFVGWIQFVVALLALFFGLVNIKDYFWYKEGLSFTIADDKKQGVFYRMRKVMDASQSFWGLAGATVVMAAGVSLVEFSCTAGFPVLWTNLLASQKVGMGLFILLLVIYMLIYQLDELAIFLTAVFTLRANRLEEKHGRILKLIGGTLMLTLAAVMAINPSLMNDLGSSLLIFGIAFAAALLTLLLHRKVLPAFGIWIGTEPRGKRRSKRHRNR